MKSSMYGGQTVDVCGACAGVWCDDRELSAVVSALIGAGKIPDGQASTAVKARQAEDHDLQTKACPRCDQITESFNFAYDSNIFLNRCGDCSGIWLDGGELRSVAQFIKNTSPD
jgi:Zn-finger nucleic acid-binding protein